MQNILVIGMGKVGSLVATLLAKRFVVKGLDKNNPATEVPFEVIEGDVSDKVLLEKLIPQFDTVVSCMPYNLNLTIAQIAYQEGKHYFDLTEDVPTTTAIRAMAAKGSKGVLAPQCGLAPGLIGIVGANLANRFTKLRDKKLRKIDIRWMLIMKRV